MRKFNFFIYLKLDFIKFDESFTLFLRFSLFCYFSEYLIDKLSLYRPGHDIKRPGKYWLSIKFSCLKKCV